MTLIPYESTLGTKRVSDPATRKDLAARTWGVFWHQSKIPFSSERMIQIKQKRGAEVKNSPPRSFWCGVHIHKLGHKYRYTEIDTNIDTNDNNWTQTHGVYTITNAYTELVDTMTHTARRTNAHIITHYLSQTYQTQSLPHSLTHAFCLSHTRTFSTHLLTHI